MDKFTYFLAYAGYISISSAIAYPLLKWKSQHPNTLASTINMVFFNTVILGLLPVLPFLMKYPPRQPVSRAESYEYFEKKRIWFWNK